MAETWRHLSSHLDSDSQGYSLEPPTSQEARPHGGWELGLPAEHQCVYWQEHQCALPQSAGDGGRASWTEMKRLLGPPSLAAAFGSQKWEQTFG